MPAPRSPEIITEPVLPDAMVKYADGLPPGDDTNVDTVADRLAVWRVVPQGQLDIDGPAAAEFIRYWQAVGPRLSQHGHRHRAEMEATFDLAFKAAGLAWSCWGSGERDLYVCGNPDGHMPPLFTVRWVLPGDAMYSDGLIEPCWYTQDGAWSGGEKTGAHHGDIAAVLHHYSERVR